MEGNSDAGATLGVLIIGAIGLIGYTWWEKHKAEVIQGIIKFFTYLAITIIILLVIYICYKIISKKLEEEDQKKKIENYFVSNLNQIKSLTNFDEAFSKIKKLTEYPSELVEKYSTEISKLKLKFEKIAKAKEREIEEEEAEEEEERKYQERLIQQKEEDIEDLFDYFKTHKSVKIIPDWATDMSYSDVNRAIEKYETLKENEKEQKKTKKRVIEFLIQNKGFPNDFVTLSREEQNLYRKYSNKGEFDLRKELGHNFGTTFHIASKLKPDEREKLLKSGFRNIPFNNPKTGKLGLNFLVWNDVRKESDYHFCLKHWFAKEFKGEVEKLVGKVRIDVVIKGIALEIETGTNKDLQVQKKVATLQKKFKKWYIVCSRKDKPKYRKFAPSKQILTMTEAYKKLKKITAKQKRDCSK